MTPDAEMHNLPPVAWPGAPGEADELPLTHALTSDDVHPGQVGVAGAEALRVAEGDHHATGDRAGEVDNPVGRGPHWRPGRDPVVDAPVTRTPGLGRRLERTVDGAVDGGQERQGGSGEDDTKHFHLQGRDELEGEDEGKAAAKGNRACRSVGR